MKNNVVYTVTWGHWSFMRMRVAHRGNVDEHRRFRKKTKARGHFSERRAERKFKADHQLMAA